MFSTQVKPVVGNKSIEVIEKVGFKEGALSFHTLTIEEVSQLSQQDLEVHLTLVYKALQKTMVAAQSSSSSATIAESNALFDRLQLLGYLFTIACSVEVMYLLLHPPGCEI